MSEKIMFPIDAVYIWVDGSDPAWLARRQDTLRAMGTVGALPHESSVAECRFLDNDELRYSLRSLARFAPWIRTVHLLTDGQKPAWLDETSVHLVHHKEIYPPQASLPVFNSSSIETVQHHIPGLSEHFLTLNDDFIFGRPVAKSHFFLADGRPRVWVAPRSAKHNRRYTEEELATLSPYAAGCARARQLVSDKFGLACNHRLRHVPKPVTVSGMNGLWETFPEILTSTMQSRFRSSSDVIVPALYACWLLATKKGQSRRINGIAQLIDALRGQLHHLGASLGEPNLAWKCAIIKRLRPLTFCLNDSENARPEDRAAMHEVLEGLFPVPSRFEKETVAC